MKKLVPLMLLVWLVSCKEEKTRSLKINEKSEVNYSEVVPDSTAKKLGEYLVLKGYFNNINHQSVNLDRSEDEQWITRFIVDKDTLNKYRDFFIPMFWFWQQDISHLVFNDQKLMVVFADQNEKDFDTLPAMRSMKFKDDDQLFYHESIKEEDAKKLADLLEKFPESGMEKFYLLKNRSGFEIRIPASELVKMNQTGSNAILTGLKYAISKYIFNGVPVELIIINNEYLEIDRIGDLDAEKKAEIDTLLLSE